MRGRKPTPTALHMLRGNPGKRRRRHEPTPPALDSETPPAWLAPAAADEWRRLAPVLGRLGVLTETDADALAAYCEAFVTWKQATDELRAGGLVHKNKHGLTLSPYVKIANQALSQMRAFLVEFGMTPSARARVKVPPPTTAPDSKWGSLL